MSWQRRQFSLSQSTSNSFTCYGWSSIIQSDACQGRLKGGPLSPVE
jgi:hypothetical protein